MLRIHLLSAFVFAAAFPAFAQRVVIQSFDDGQIADPFFAHAFDFDADCCRSLAAEPDLKGLALFLAPNSDVVTLLPAADEVVDSFSVTLVDFEGGFVGDSPTTAVIVRGVFDSVVLHADAIGIPQDVGADRRAIGTFSGVPIGPIVEVDFQASNSGNSLNSQVGAFFDDLTAMVQIRCDNDITQDGTIDLSDLALLLANFGTTSEAPAPGDLDGDLDVDLNDLAQLLSAFGATCPS